MDNDKKSKVDVVIINVKINLVLLLDLLLFYY